VTKRGSTDGKVVIGGVVKSGDLCVNLRNIITGILSRGKREEKLP